MITEENVRFGENWSIGTTLVQEIIVNDVSVGCHYAFSQGWLRPLHEEFQLHCPQEDIPPGVISTTHRDDDDMHYVVVENLEEFIKIFNKIFG